MAMQMLSYLYMSISLYCKSHILPKSKYDDIEGSYKDLEEFG